MSVLVKTAILRCISVKNGSDCLSAQGLEKGFLSGLRAKLAEWLGLCGVSYRVSRQSCRILKAVGGIILLHAQTCRKRVRLLDMIFTVSGRRSEASAWHDYAKAKLLYPNNLLGVAAWHRSEHMLSVSVLDP